MTSTQSKHYKIHISTVPLSLDLRTQSFFMLISHL